MKLIFANLAVGALLFHLGIDNGGAALAVSWIGISFILTGLGYATNNAGIYGKQATGRLPFWAVMLHLPFFIYALIVWHIVRLLIRENAYDRITDNIVIGRRLLAAEYPDGIDIIVDLTAEFIEPAGVIGTAQYIALPILDGSVPESNALNAAIKKIAGGNIYIHCAQGHGRTGLFVSILLINRGVVSNLDEALALLKNKRPALALTPKQKQFVRNVTENPSD
jgi:hypothetical protein